MIYIIIITLPSAQDALPQSCTASTTHWWRTLRPHRRRPRRPWQRRRRWQRRRQRPRWPSRLRRRRLRHDQSFEPLHSPSKPSSPDTVSATTASSRSSTVHRGVEAAGASITMRRPGGARPVRRCTSMQCPYSCRKDRHPRRRKSCRCRKSCRRRGRSSASTATPTAARYDGLVVRGLRVYDDHVPTIPINCRVVHGQ